MFGKVFVCITSHFVTVAWLAAAGDRCTQQSGISIQEVSVHSNLIEEFEWWALTVTLPT